MGTVRLRIYDFEDQRCCKYGMCVPTQDLVVSTPVGMW